MKKITIKFSCFLCLSFLVIGCFGHEEDFPTSWQSIYEPVIMNRAEFEYSVGTLPSQNIVTSGKIYIFDNFLFISEVNDGFHVYNYQDPTNPVPLMYIKAPGATDLAIRNNILYINQAIDLITLKFNYQTATFEFMHRNRDVFPQKITPDGFFTPVNSDEIIVNWTFN
jgi:hypothetical protein